MMADREHAIRQPQYTRIAPGRYTAACIRASHYFDKAIRRWVCFLLWSLFNTERTKIPQWFNLGAKDKPYAPLRSTYLKEWVRANGGPPQRGDRLSPRVFRGRIAQVEIADTEKSAISYSVVRKILTWQVAHIPVKQSSNEAMKDGMGEVAQKTELTQNACQILGVPKPSEAKGRREISGKWDGSFGNCESPKSVSYSRKHALFWAEKNPFAYQRFCREIETIRGATIGAFKFDSDAAVCGAAQKTGVPDHIALALTRGAAPDS